jgi:hypothetical protein
MLLVLSGRAGHLYLNATIILTQGNAIYTSKRFLGLRQCVDVNSPNMLDLAFANFTDLSLFLPTPDWSRLIHITLL